MPKTRRLSRVDFSGLVTLRREAGRFFTLTVAKSPDNTTRFACVISKKTAHKAHDRNLIKRRCRATFAKASLRAPYALVFTAKRSVMGATFPEISGDIENLIVKAAASLKVPAELQ